MLIAIAFLTCTPLAVGAAAIENITRDFKPISGYVVMSEGDEFIIDLDQTNGIQTGDIFSVIAPGKKIIHPVTKKELGSLETVKGMLKVTRIKSGYSFARPVGKVAEIERGNPIRRFGNLPALFWDYTGKGLPLFIRLQKNLNDLKWTDYNSAQKSRPQEPKANEATSRALTFILTDRTLEVRDPEFMIIRSYDYSEDVFSKDTKSSATVGASGAAASMAPDTRASRDAGDHAAFPSRKEDVGGRSLSLSFSEVQTIANLPDVAIVTDFIYFENQLLMASSNGKRIQIFDIADKLNLIADGKPNYPVRILSLKWWTPQGKATPYLSANVWSDRDKKVYGSLFRIDGSSLKPVIQGIPRILGTFDSNGDGKPEVLLGQEFAGDTFFGRRLNELKLNGNKIDYIKPKLEFPRNFTVLGSVLADVTGNGQVETIYVRNRILYVYSGKKRLYKSPKQMGGSLSFLTYDIKPNTRNIQPTSVEFEISPIVHDLNGDGIAEILAVASERDLLGNLSISAGVEKSWLAVFRYKDGRFESGRLGSELDKPLQGLTVDQHRVLFVTTEPGDITGEGAGSHLLAYSVSQ